MFLGDKLSKYVIMKEVKSKKLFRSISDYSTPFISQKVPKYKKSVYFLVKIRDFEYFYSELI